MKKAILLLLPLLITLSACKSQTVVKGWNTYTNNEYKYTIQYPKDWMHSLVSTAHLFKPENLVAILSTGSVNVVTENMNIDMSNAKYAELSVKNLQESMGVTGISRTTSRIGIYEAEKLTYDMVDPEITTHITQYCLVHNKDGYVITIAKYDDDYQTDNIANQVANTFRFK